MGPELGPGLYPCPTRTGSPNVLVADLARR
jgi:hypothetical protein